MTTPQPGFRLLEELYADPEMRSIWSAEAGVEAWLRVEAQLALAEADAGVLTHEEAALIADACQLSRIDLEALWESARTVGYPILGLVRQISALLPEGPGGRVHFGATTQDIMDTGLALQLTAACAHLRGQVSALGGAVMGLVESHRDTPMAARTHGQIAVPTTFGAKMAVYLDQLSDATESLARVQHEVAVASFFGAGGTSAAVFPHGPKIRQRLAERLGLRAHGVPGHVSRGRLARYGFECALIATLCARFAREVVDLSRNEIGEVAEMQGPHRGASSTMPQKANPISSESIIGFAIAAQSESGALLRAVEASHERSAGEWQSEWILLPQVSEHAASCLRLAIQLVATLEIHPSKMDENLNSAEGFAMSEALMMRLAATLGRERAHDLVYEAVRRAHHNHTDLILECQALVTGLRLGITLNAVDPASYLGEARGVCETSVVRWLAVDGALS